MSERLSDVTHGTDTSAEGAPSDDAGATTTTENDPTSGHATGAASPDAAPGMADSRETTEGTVYTVTGGDWDEVLAEAAGDERIVMNLGPQHPSTHGVLRLVLELEGETVTQARSVIGYLHTGIEKNTEYRTWTQGVTFVTRMDYLAPLHSEAAYCLAVEKLLGIEVPQRAQDARVLLMELNRVSSHLVALATGGMELGALTGMTAGFREREEVLHLLEHLTGLRMNHAFIRPGGLAQDLPADTAEKVLAFLKVMDSRLPDYDKLLTGQPIWRNRLSGVGYLPVDACLALGITGPPLRSAGLPWDLRKVEPYSGYENYEFEVPTANEADCFARYRLRLEEIHQSLKIVRQAVERLREPGPVMVADAKVAWPAQLTIGSDGMGNSLEHVRKIMGQSMESLIHHFKLVTEGFHVPAGQVYVPVESPRGELGFHVVSDGGTRPMRVHVREPSFVNLQAMPAMCEGSMVADVIASVASLDPVMGGCDR
ncbi:NADH-quinone oxidoreductase subunit D [Actinosynnema pretiosum subsp. pretiosum]|uniref:NADH-quinone oxidoreductase subunit D n=3 Tax=Actinosynnema TaxID=40566 RepID=C6WNB2_ACTMD|nr:NADH-quinone oxidoreductase subunit D [Actinosynnema mirum]ACU40476.1 NADH dehydrogenase I, D subunit [Actinosynnema mirum DSM 43827]AXX33990.1 NADH-ubiquinone oxidoreductase chain D [Actinosynnema pretiosum subsp. pretiosum]QUF02268.1 NADH-quinone oxidoreductase subunit D [Actinosynnema pretiosum subsp. pretiosum]